MTDKEKRDFISEEIRKKIIGPGYTEDSYACLPDASDEIVVNRPQIVYTGGILFPKEARVIAGASSLNNITPASTSTVSSNGGDDSFANTLSTDNLFGRPPYGVNNNSNETDEDSNASGTSSDNELYDTQPDSSSDTDTSDNSNSDLGGPDETYEYKPTLIGLVTCLHANTQSVEVSITYGQYHEVAEKDLHSEVKVKLGVCTLEQLKETFNYYNQYAKETLSDYHANSIEDLFTINPDGTVSPNRHFIKQIQQSNGSVKEHRLGSKEFPILLRNKAAKILTQLANDPTNSQTLEGITWVDFTNQLAIFDQLSQVQDILNRNGWDSLGSAMTYNSNDNAVRITSHHFDKDPEIDLWDILSIFDPVREFVLDKLLQFHYFKRESINPDTITLTIGNGISSGEQTINDDIVLFWKTIQSRTNPEIKYLRLLAQNRHEKQLDNKGQLRNIPTTSYIYQLEMKVSSLNIVPYLEPHHSVIDNEYNLNEILYSDEYVFGKGVNCALTWEQNNNPTWVKTTYFPKQVVKAFSTASDDQAINNACDVFDLTIWSQVDKNEIIARFRAMASSYLVWQQQQITASTTADLNVVITQQQEFYARLIDNINYLDNNDRAYRCFKVANTAMYIQMLLSRDDRFKVKGRDWLTYNQHEANIFGQGAWDYFKSNSSNVHPAYRPFQLTFLLMNVRSTFEPTDLYHNNIIDLIWFPTGGGKTEAYLALTALTIAERRSSGSHKDLTGVSVIMRYTLRLLTAQQFERASYLIFALDFLRNEFLNRNLTNDYNLGGANDRITIGMWIGKASTPNKFSDLNYWRYSSFFNTVNGDPRRNIAPSLPLSNPFPISCCPWCGCNLVGEPNNGVVPCGYNRRSPALSCINNNICYFNRLGLPIDYIDECIYNNPPTLLFATVDKFAQLTKSEAGRLFCKGIPNRRKPDLIIQDELHLISGPLGSLVGMYETMVEELCKEYDNQGHVIRKPKIIASTATTRNTKSLIRQLYNRDVRTFPVSGIRYNDNFFSRVLPAENSKRLYVGLSPTGHTASELEIRTVAAELVAREKMILAELEAIQPTIDMFDYTQVYRAIEDGGKLKSDFDNYWTLVLYYNNMKSLGRAHSRIGQEIWGNAHSMRSFMRTYPTLNFILEGFPNRSTEFTSRQDSSRIKQLLIQAEERTNLRLQGKKYRVSSMMDIVQATNMISVGIDIARWNVMIMVGQPLTTAEYIQSSSRVGRTTYGLIVNLYNPLRARELSFYENYEAYHQVFYKYVEPLSVTAFTDLTLKKLLTNLYVTYMVQVKSCARPNQVSQAYVQELIDLLGARSVSTGAYAGFNGLLRDKLDEIHHFFVSDQRRLNRSFGQSLKDDTDLAFSYPAMNSLRDVESNTYIRYE